MPKRARGTLVAIVKDAIHVEIEEEHTMRSAMLLTSAVALTALPFLGSGCVQQDRYDSLLTANRWLSTVLMAQEIFGRCPAKGTP